MWCTRPACALWRDAKGDRRQDGPGCTGWTVATTRDGAVWSEVSRRASDVNAICSHRLLPSPRPNPSKRGRAALLICPQRLERDGPGVSKSILEGLDEILTIARCSCLIPGFSWRATVQC